MQIIQKPRPELEELAVQIIKKKISDKISGDLGNLGDTSAPSVSDTEQKFNLFLPGGSSTTGILNKLADANIDWSRVNVFLTDERAVSIDSDDSNFNKLNNELFSKINIPPQNLHPIDWTNEKSWNFDVPTPDLILLSAGPDGHVASLFPNHESYLGSTVSSDENSAAKSVTDRNLGYIKVTDSPKLPADRISLSRAAIESAHSAILLIFGQERRDVLQKFATSPELPANIVTKIAESYVLSDVIK